MKCIKWLVLLVIVGFGIHFTMFMTNKDGSIDEYIPKLIEDINVVQDKFEDVSYDFSKEEVVREKIVIEHSKEDQTIEINGILVEIPGLYFDEDDSGELSVEKITRNDSDDIFDTRYEINLDNQHILDTYISIEIPFEDKNYNEGLTYLDTMVTEYYDEKAKEWKYMSSYYDADKKKIIMPTSHLTNIRFRPSTQDEKNELMEELPRPMLCYSSEIGFYNQSMSVEELNALKNNHKVSTMVVKQLIGYEPLGVGQTPDGLVDTLRTSSLNSSLSTAKSYYDAADTFVVKQLNEFGDHKYDNIIKAGNKFAEAVNNSGIGSTKANTTFDHFLKQVESYSKNAGKIGLIKMLGQYTGYMGDVMNVTKIITDAGKSDYVSMYYESGKLLLDKTMLSKLGPQGALAAAVISCVERWSQKYYQEYRAGETNDVVMAYTQFYNKYDKETGKGYKYWYTRLKELTEENKSTPELTFDMWYGEIEDYYYQIFNKENKALREASDFSENMLINFFSNVDFESKEFKDQVVNLYKAEVVHPMISNILSIYGKELQNKAIDYYLIAKRCIDELYINDVREIEIISNTDIYNPQNSVINIQVDGKVLWSEQVNKNGKNIFKARVYKLLPENENAPNNIEVVGLYSDSENNALKTNTKKETLELFNMFTPTTVNFNEIIAKIKIVEDKDSISIATDESYEFAYDYEEAKGDENIIYPEEVKWSCSGGNISKSGMFNADNAGTYNVTVTGIFSNGQKTTDRIKVEVTGQAVVTETPTTNSNNGNEQEDLDTRLEKYTKAIETAILKNTPPKHPGFEKDSESFQYSGLSAKGRISYKRVVSEYTKSKITQRISYSSTVQVFKDEAQKEFWVNDAYSMKEKWQNGKVLFYDCSDITKQKDGVSWYTSRIVTRDNMNLANGGSLNNFITFFIIENDYRINCTISVSFIEKIIDYVPSDFKQSNVKKLIDDVQAEINKVNY